MQEMGCSHNRGRVSVRITAVISIGRVRSTNIHPLRKTTLLCTRARVYHIPSTTNILTNIILYNLNITMLRERNIFRLHLNKKHLNSVTLKYAFN